MKPSLDVAFITYNGLPDGDPDDLLALSELVAKGLKVAVFDWRKVSPSDLDSRLVVLRSTWDYHHHHSEFLDWVDVLAGRTNLKNAPDLVRWNSNKRYLADIERRGISIVPTIYIDQKDAAAISPSAFSALLKGSNIGTDCDVVIKPAVGLSTFGVKRFSTAPAHHADICAHVAGLAASADVLIQPYLTSVENNGEHALMFFDGKFSHAVSKTHFQKMAAAGDAGEKSVDASPDEIAFGERVLKELGQLCDSQPLYARVDLVRDKDGGLVLMELELVEPSLFLGWGKQASTRFAAAIEAALN